MKQSKAAQAFLRTAYSLQRKIQAEAAKVPEAGKEFADKVLLTTREIISTIERIRYVTPNQIQALQNILAGLKKWTRRKKSYGNKTK